VLSTPIPSEASASFTAEDVRAILDAIRPYFERDGGGIELVAIEGCNVRVRLHGACTSCPSVSTSLQFGVERRLREELPGFGELIADTNSDRTTPKRWWQFLG
jgi:Fe-S cluster biogenesis protein NfuA